MAESNVPKQDFAPPWLKFPSTDSSKTQSQNGYQNERNRQRREDPYHSRSDYSHHLHRQNSFEFNEAKRYPQSQGKYRHHSIDDDYYNYAYGNYGYYSPSYNYEKFGMQYGPQQPLGRNGSRDVKHTPGRFSQTPVKRGYYDKEHHKDSKDLDGRIRDKNSDRDRPFSEDFPLLKGAGQNTPETKQTKPGSGVWGNPLKSTKNEESTDMLKNTGSGVYKALVPCKNGQMKTNGSESTRTNGKNSSPLSPSNKSNHKEFQVLRHSPTSDLAIVTQPKKLGDKKSDFLRALRHESSLRNGDSYQDLNQNSIVKKTISKELYESPVNGNARNYNHINGNWEHQNVDSCRRDVGENKKKCGHSLDKHLVTDESSVNGEANVDHTYLLGDEEEKRLLESMGWSEEDQTEYVITDDDVKEFQHMLNRVREQSDQGNPIRDGILRLKLGTHFANGLLNGTNHGHQDSQADSL